MQLIDDEGRLFGRVNVIDALVVLFVLAVLVAGVALVTGSGGSPDTDTGPSTGAEYATLTIGPLPADGSGGPATGETLTFRNGGSTLEVVDSYRTPHPTRDASLAVVRVRLPEAGTSLNQSFRVRSEQTVLNATVRGFSNSSALDTSTESFVLRTSVPTAVAENVEPGDSHRIGADTAATVTGVQYVESQGGTVQLRLGMEAETLQSGSGSEYTTRPLRTGTTLPFRTETYSLEGAVVSLDDALPQRRSLTTQMQTTVPRPVAAAIESGDEYRIGNRTVASIESVDTYPVADTTQRRLALNVTLRTVRDGDTQQFLGEDVRVNSTLPFRTPDYQFEGTVVGFGQRPGTPVDATLTVDWEGVRPAQADAVGVGMEEAHRGADAAITDVEREPATVILRTENGEIYARDHPVNEDVRLTLSVRARQLDGGLSFHGQPTQTGDRVVLDFGSVTVRGTVVDIEAE